MYNVKCKGYPDKPVNSKQVVAMLLELAGGGYTTSQTIKAMTNKGKLDNGQKVSLKYKDKILHFSKIGVN